MDWVAIFFGGLLGSSHCLGMCGGFALTLGASNPCLNRTLVQQCVYTCGRLFTYSFFGAVAGAMGSYVSRWQGPMIGLQQVISVLAGVAMFVVGVGVLSGRTGVMLNGSSLVRRVTNHLAPGFKALLVGPGAWSAFIAGLFTGFLPCGLLYAFLALAMTAGDPFRAALTMLIFGLGTAPAMIALGCGGALTSHVVRARVQRVAACFVVLLGAATIARGLPFVPCDWSHLGGLTGSHACHCKKL